MVQEHDKPKRNVFVQTNCPSIPYPSPYVRHIFSLSRVQETEKLKANSGKCKREEKEDKNNNNDTKKQEKTTDCDKTRLKTVIQITYIMNIKLFKKTMKSLTESH